jgi:hypothetical protein
MKEIMIGALLMFSMTARSAEILKKVDLKRECSVEASTKSSQYEIKITRKIGELKTTESKSFKIDNLAKTIALAFNSATTPSNGNMTGVTFTAVHALPVRNGTEDVAFNLHPNDSKEAASLVFLLNELCR